MIKIPQIGSDTAYMPYADAFVVLFLGIRTTDKLAPPTLRIGGGCPQRSFERQWDVKVTKVQVSQFRRLCNSTDALRTVVMQVDNDNYVPVVHPQSRTLAVLRFGLASKRSENISTPGQSLTKTAGSQIPNFIPTIF